MSHEDQTKEGYTSTPSAGTWAVKGEDEKLAKRRQPMQETLQQGKEHGAAHTQEEEGQRKREQEGLRNQGGGLPVLPVFGA
jgi:hypothetical protein